MRVWLVTIGEPLPIDGPDVRLYRVGLLANQLASRGHHVVWWTSTYSHAKKEFRYTRDTDLTVNANLRMVLLHSVPYRSNVSVSRLINHYELGRKFAQRAETEPKPDVILASLPSLDLSAAATVYGERHRVPVVVDVRDLWPDVFLDLAPRWARPLARLPLLPMFASARAICKRATALTGTTPAYVEWALGHAGRTRADHDRDFPLGYTAVSPKPLDMASAEAFWAQRGVGKQSDEFVACFYGTIGRQFELETVIEAARLLNGHPGKFRFIICGCGDKLGHYRRLAKDCPQIDFPGWVGAAQIWVLSRIAQVGLAPYHSSPNFVSNVPNKPIEYLSAGLPVVSSLKGALERLLSDRHCGVTFENGNASDLAQVLLNLQNTPDLLTKLSANAQAAYRSKFVAETVYGEMCDYLEDVAFL